MREVSIAFQTDKTAARYIALARQVDQYDFDAISVYCDAPFQPSGAALLLMAPHIRRARLGAAAMSPFRIHPIDIAAETALLAALAAGGVYIGLARGAWLADHGIREPAQPIRAIREAIGVVRYLLEGGEGGFVGETFSLAPHVRAPYPVPAARVPILIGSWGRQLCALAGKLADEVKVGGSANPAIVPVIQSYIVEGEAAAGRAPGSVGVVMGAVTVCDENRAAARAAARRALALYLPVCAPLDPTVQVEPELIARLSGLADAARWDEAAALISDDLVDRFAFAGNPEDLIAHAERLYAAGASRIEFGTPHGLQPEHGIDLIGSRVIPALKRATL